MKVLLILGNRMNDDGTISDIMEKRLIGSLELINHELINKTPFDKIICSGGIANEKAGISEAYKMKEYLVNHGINQDMIIEEDQSLTTVMNMSCSAPIIKNLKPDVVYLLSSKSHLDRLINKPIELFKQYMPGIKVIPYGVE